MSVFRKREPAAMTSTLDLGDTALTPIREVVSAQRFNAAGEKDVMSAVIEGVVDQVGYAMRVAVAVAPCAQLPLRFEGARRLEALIDTGATWSMLSRDLILELGLVPTGRMLRTTAPTGEIENAEYKVDIGFTAPPQSGTNDLPFFRTITGCTVVPVPSEIGGCKVIIGMDVLMPCGLTLLPNRKFYLHV